MPSFLVGDIQVNDADKYQTYIAQVPAFVAKWQGEYVVRGGEASTVEGNWRPGRMVVIQFPDRAHAEGFVNDPAYAAVAAIRHQAAITNLVIVDGPT